MDAWDDLQKDLRPGEVVEGVVFGEWEGWGGERPFGPKHLIGKLLTAEEAEPHMHGWRFYTPHGLPESYPTVVWTQTRVLFVTQYDGATCLDWVPRHPTHGHVPYMPGG